LQETETHCSSYRDSKYSWLVSCYYRSYAGKQEGVFYRTQCSHSDFECVFEVIQGHSEKKDKCVVQPTFCRRKCNATVGLWRRSSVRVLLFLCLITSL